MVTEWQFRRAGPIIHGGARVAGRRACYKNSKNLYKRYYIPQSAPLAVIFFKFSSKARAFCNSIARLHCSAMHALYWLAGTAALLQMLCCHPAAELVEVENGMPFGKSLGNHQCIQDKVRNHNIECRCRGILLVIRAYCMQWCWLAS